MITVTLRRTKASVPKHHRLPFCWEWACPLLHFKTTSPQCNLIMPKEREERIKWCVLRKQREFERANTTRHCLWTARHRGSGQTSVSWNSCCIFLLLYSLDSPRPRKPDTSKPLAPLTPAPMSAAVWVTSETADHVVRHWEYTGRPITRMNITRAWRYPLGIKRRRQFSFPFSGITENEAKTSLCLNFYRRSADRFI